MNRRVVLIAATLSLVPLTAHGQGAEDLVAVVSCGLTSANGIVSHADANAIDIVTPRHLVSDDCGQRPIEVTFRRDGTRQWPAERIFVSSNATLDVAVVRVSDRRAPKFDNDQFYAVGESLALRRDDPVRVIAKRLGQDWVMPRRYDVVNYVDGDVIKIESTTTDRGASGGAVVNGQGLIVGMIVQVNPPIADAVPLHRIQMALVANNVRVSWGIPSTPPPVSPGPVVVDPGPPGPRPEEIVHGNLIFQLPPGARRQPTQGRDVVLLWEGSPPWSPHIILRTGAKLSGEFRAAVDASLAEGDNMLSYTELQFRTHKGDIRMYRMNGALMMGEQTVKQLIWYVALNSENTFDEVVLFVPEYNSYRYDAVIKVFEQFLQNVDLVNARRRRNAP